MNLDFDFPEWAEMLFAKSRYKVAHGGRGSSKSWSAVRALLIYSFRTNERILCGREIQRSIKDSSKKLVEDTIKAYNLIL